MVGEQSAASWQYHVSSGCGFQRESGETGETTVRCMKRLLMCVTDCSPPLPPGGGVPWFPSLGKNILIRILLQKDVLGGRGMAEGGK